MRILNGLREYIVSLFEGKPKMGWLLNEEIIKARSALIFKRTEFGDTITFLRISLK